MAFLDRFERRVENFVNSAFAKAFRSQVKPVELASALRREIDDRAAVVARDRTIAPNELTIELSTEDFDHIAEWGADALAGELAEAAMEHGMSQHYVFVGPVTVTFTENTALEVGRFEVRSAIVRGETPAGMFGPTRSHPILDIDGQRYLLTGAVTVIGRGSEADIIVDDSGISRRHLEIRITPDGVIATDMGSTNGSFVEGQRIQAVTLVNGNTLTIGRTTIVYSSGEDEDGDGVA